MEDHYCNNQMCIFCQGSHTPVNCDNVKNLQQRLEITKCDRLCCLGSHKVSQCRSKGRCRRCNRKHHTSLCAGTENSIEMRNTPNEISGNASNGTSGSASNEQTTNTTLTNLSSNHSATTPHADRVCLLKTAIVTVSSTHIEAEINILFDEGSQRSFLTRDIADTLLLQPTGKEDICISSFRAKTPSARRRMLHLLT